MVPFTHYEALTLRSVRVLRMTTAGLGDALLVGA